MSSPNSPTTAEEGPKKNHEQITFRFCGDCSNMLYPKEDESSHKLQFTCRTCQYTEEAITTCVYRNDMNTAAGATAGVTQDVGSDPTVCTHSSSASTAAAVAPRTGVGAIDQGGVHHRGNIPTDPAICLKCGHVLLQCRRCDDVATISEYIDFVNTHPDFALQRSLGYVESATLYKSLDDDERDAWDTTFVSDFERGQRPSPREYPDDISQYLGLEIAVSSDSDPPEALGLDYEDSDIRAFI